MSSATGNQSEATGQKNLCVFCGSALGARPEYEQAAQRLGAAIARAGMGVVYGGASVGLMGAVADAALAAGGPVYGVLPQVLVERELAHPGLTRLEAVATMHERKARMAQLSSGFIALPGGFGTLDELMEAVTWTLLGIHAKPCVLLNVDGYWDGLVEFLDTAIGEGFVKEKSRRLLTVAATVEEAVALAQVDLSHG